MIFNISVHLHSSPRYITSSLRYITNSQSDQGSAGFMTQSVRHDTGTQANSINSGNDIINNGPYSYLSIELDLACNGGSCGGISL